MRLAPHRSSARRDTVSFILCVVLSVTGLFLPPATGDAITAFVRQTALQPVLWLQHAAEQGRTSRARFDAVVAQRDSAAMAALSLPALEAENRQLRKILLLSRRLATGYVAVDVLHQTLPTDGRSILLGGGSSSGIAAFNPVVSADGLVGVVRTADPEQSVVMTWAHPEFRVSAFTEDGTVFGIVAPVEGGSAAETPLELRGVPYRDSIGLGVRVMTSGLGGVFPNGIPIGTVVGVSREEKGWERTYLVRPAANPLTISHVIVLTGPAGGSVRPAFVPPDSTPP